MAAASAAAGTAAAALRHISACPGPQPRRCRRCRCCGSATFTAQQTEAVGQRPALPASVRAFPASLVRRKPWQLDATSSLANYPMLPGDDQGPLIHTILETDSEDLEVRGPGMRQILVSDNVQQ